MMMMRMINNVMCSFGYHQYQQLFLVPGSFPIHKWYPLWQESTGDLFFHLDLSVVPRGIYYVQHAADSGPLLLLYKARCFKKKLSSIEFEEKILLYRNIEKYNAMKNGKLDLHLRK